MPSGNAIPMEVLMQAGMCSKAICAMKHQGTVIPNGWRKWGMVKNLPKTGQLNLGKVHLAPPMQTKNFPC